MKAYADKLQEYLTTNPIKFENQDTETFIDALYWYYSQTNPICNDTLQNLNDKLLVHLSHLSIQKIDEIFNIYMEMCLEQERLAFQGGIRIGTLIMKELHL